jgi:hypothetical protein
MLKPIVIAVLLASALLIAVFPLSAAQVSASSVEPSDITISTNEAIYVLGEKVQVTGRVLPPLDLNNLLRMTVFTPAGEIFLIDELEINSDGGFTWSYLPTTEAGEWIVNARFSTKETEVVINVLETDLFDKVLMENPALLDLQGNPVTEGRVGESMAITATLINDEQVSQSFMFIVQIIDEDGAVSSLLLTPGSLQPVESINPSVPWLPKEKGDYNAEIFVWTSLNTPTPLVEKQAVAFSIS